jgi:hypothetical protein
VRGDDDFSPHLHMTDFAFLFFCVLWSTDLLPPSDSALIHFANEDPIALEIEEDLILLTREGALIVYMKAHIVR